jgi:hypothetical protein
MVIGSLGRTSNPRKNIMSATSLKEIYFKFFQDPNREVLRDILNLHTGEINECDFKESWPSVDYLVRTSIAYANAGKGMLIIGVKGNEDKSFNPIGLNQFEDKTRILDSLKKFLPIDIQLDIIDFDYAASDYPILSGIKFQVFSVEASLGKVPYAVMWDGEKIIKNRIYVRKNVSTVEAEYSDLMNLIKKRYENHEVIDRKELREHLEDLKILYSHKSLFNPLGRAYYAVHQAYTDLGISNKSESFDDKIDDFIKRKIKLIERCLGI